MSNPLVGSDVNPLKTDPDLVSLLKRLDKVKKYKTFQRWKGKFLDRLESFLYEKGMKPAEKASLEFDTKLKGFVKSANKVQEFIEKGELSDEKKTVKASLALNEMCKSLTVLCEDIDAVIPMTSAEEKKRGFSKFHLGAALIRQGFHQYVKMKAVEDALTDIGARLVHVADKQQHDLFLFYKKTVEKFCDVMADLHLYEVMLKCVEFLEAPEEEESSEEEPVTIKITIHTLDGKILTLTLDPMDTVGNVKAAIEGACGIVPDKQILKFNGAKLDKPDATLASYGIQDGSKLTVEPFRVAVTVNTMDGKQIKVMIDPSDFMSNIKVQLEDETGVPARNQAIFMNGVELSDPNMTADEYGIKEGCVLDLEPKVINVTVKTPDGKSIQVQVRPSDTAEQIKQKIAAQVGMKVPQQILKVNGKEMKDGSTVKSMGIKEGSEITVDILRVPVTVNTMDGKSIKIMIDPTDYLSDIKRQLEGESGVLAKNQKLSMNGVELADPNKTASQYGIQGGSVLDLEPSVMSVKVTTPEGKTFSVEVSPTDTAEAVKQKVAKVSGMPVGKQVLKHNGAEFTNGKTVKDMKILDGSNLSVEIFKIPVTVKTMDGKSINVMIDPTDRISDIKVQLQDTTGVAATNQNLFIDGNEISDPNKTAQDYGVKAGSILSLEPKVIKVNVSTPDRKVLNIEVKPTDTAEEVKGKIAKLSGMNVPQQVLMHQGKEFANGKTIRDMGIQDGSNLNVEIFKVPITLNTMDGKSIKVMIDPTNKMIDIKSQLEKESGVPATNQKIFMDGQELSDPNKTASDYGIKAGSILDLEPSIIKVNVTTPNGKKITIEVKPTDKAEEVKGKIAKLAGMNVPQQILMHKGKEFANGKTIKDMGIQDGSDLIVEILKVPITVNTMEGKSIKVMIDPTDKISDIKVQLEKESGVPASNQKLSMDGQEFSDPNKSASDYGVKKGSVLDLHPKVIKVTVETPDGKKHDVQIEPSDTADAIKGKIAQASGMAAPRQVLKVDGKELPKGKTAAEMGIREGTTIKVDIFKLPITVKTKDGSSFSLGVEPGDSVDNIKKLIHKEIGMEPKKQLLKLADKELRGSSTAKECGIEAGSVLVLDEIADPIIFVDIKSGTLFAVERDVVIKKEALKINENNKLDFLEATKDPAARERIVQSMKASPKLGVSNQVVVTGLEVDDYDLEEAEKVKGVWGVSLKKREKNKKGEEFLFVDPKTGACGELFRPKYIDMKFITPVQEAKGETIAEREKDHLMYDKYVAMIRGIFGIKFQ